MEIMLQGISHVFIIVYFVRMLDFLYIRKRKTYH